ncbi:hypothetical protein [Streptococcus equi]|uniref:hypothetical protein n=1 Tax=Streptococcus equi TaxID=1336 RepID=UPI001E354E57
MTIAVGVAAIVMTAGAATPLVVGAFVVGSGTVAYGASNLYEAGHNIYLGSVGDGVTVATNPLRDTLFMGNDRLYHQVGGLFTTASAALIPIGQTKSVAKGLTEFTIGEVGGFISGQASYHGTKLLGGSEQDAQRATLVGNILGGLAASSVARRFSLNEPIAARVTKPAYNRQQLLKNLEHSRLARQSSRFKSYVAREKLAKFRVATAELENNFENVRIKAFDLVLTDTVKNHSKDIIRKGKYVGQKARPYIENPGTQTLIQEIMDAEKPSVDKFLLNGLRWDVRGSFNGRSEGIWELVVDLETNRIVHFNFTR